MPANLMTRLRDGLAGSGFQIPDIPGVGDLGDLGDLLGDGFPGIPGFGTTVDLSVERVRFAPFNTSAGVRLSHGIVVIGSGASMPLMLQ